MSKVKHWQDVLGFDPKTDAGWIPPEDRSPEQRALTARTMAAMPSFNEVNPPAGEELPKTALIPDLELAAFGKTLAMFFQFIGSCVGVGGAKAYQNAAVGDVFHRGDAEEVKPCFPFATWGVGREIAGLGGRGDGSWGAAQAQAVEEFGQLAWDHPKMPKPSSSDGWMKYSATVEREWSWPRQWPVSRSELAADALSASIQSVVKIGSTDEAARLAAQGYGLTQASMFGLASNTALKVDQGFLMGGWTGSWSHQMSISGYATHPSRGRIWWIQNQWGDCHGHCPTMAPKGVTGGFWIDDATFARIIRAGETFGHSNTKGFPKRKIKWGNLGIGV